MVLYAIFTEYRISFRAADRVLRREHIQRVRRLHNGGGTVIAVLAVLYGGHESPCADEHAAEDRTEAEEIVAVGTPGAVAEFLLVSELMVEQKAVSGLKLLGLPVTLAHGELHGVVLAPGPHACVAVQQVHCPIAADPQAVGCSERREV